MDFAFAYAGMGHVTVASTDGERVHYRTDGGANDYDRAENARRAAQGPRGAGHAPEEWIKRVKEDVLVINNTG